MATIGYQPKPAILAECSALSHFALATVVSQLHSRTCTLTIAVSQLQSHNCIHIWILTAALMHSQPSLVLLCPDVQMTKSRRVWSQSQARQPNRISPPKGSIPVILSMFHSDTIALSQIVLLQMYSHNGKSFDVNLAVNA